VTGSPGPGVLRRLRPARPVQRSARLSPPRAGGPAAGNRDRAVPAFTVIRSAEEEPGCVPAASPWVRRRPSPWPPRAGQRATPGSSRRKRPGGTHRARPLSTRFEPVYGLKDVTAPVPRVLLSATLTGPGPSGSTGTSRLCQGCSRPPRHHPDQAALSFTTLLRQDGGEGLSPPLEQQRLAAPGGAASRRSLEDV